MKAIILLVAGLVLAWSLPAEAGVIFSQDFETDTSGWLDGSGTITRVGSGSNGVASADGSWHAEVDGPGPFTRFGAYSSVWPAGGFTTTLDAYLDTSWAIGDGFDYTSAASGSDGAHQRDFIFHVGVADDGRLLVNGDNNAYGTVNSYVLTNGGDGTPFEVITSGWYTMEHVFYASGGQLAVDLNFRDAGGSLLWSTTRTNAADTIPGEVGGNRYGWFPTNTLDALAIDNSELAVAAVPLPAALPAALALLVLFGMTRVHRRIRLSRAVR